MTAAATTKKKATSKQAGKASLGKATPVVNKPAAAASATAPQASKTTIASASLNDQVTQLLEIAAGAPKQSFSSAKSASKLFELAVLARVLKRYALKHGQNSVSVKNVNSGILSLAGGPASADDKIYSFFEMKNSAGTLQHEAWVSVQVKTLSWSMSSVSPFPPAGMHEIDVAIFAAGSRGHPPHTALLAGFSCKHLKPQKASVREALGLRRETARLSSAQASSVPWLKSVVPARPASPMYLAASSAGVLSYRRPVDEVGVYMMWVTFP
nr:hypothetical protein [uncultured Duganella sp.]